LSPSLKLWVLLHINLMTYFLIRRNFYDFFIRYDYLNQILELEVCQMNDFILRFLLYLFHLYANLNLFIFYLNLNNYLDLFIFLVFLSFWIETNLLIWNLNVNVILMFMVSIKLIKFIFTLIFWIIKLLGTFYFIPQKLFCYLWPSIDIKIIQ